MKTVVAAMLFAVAAPAAALAAPGQSAPAAAKFNIDTPVEVLAADPAAKAVLDADMPGMLTHPSYEMFKAMSLRQLQPFSEGKITDEILAKIDADLAAIK
ncbi:hypothetical protein ACFQ1E_01020 [Sphingomonas canadensis]|uniref:Uncharacterized protein n=1 Tax=Sphingomonas canadensis TaxID=1219257 RepID=A0ABW3H218_9SPHN|nr:hypothetical protein [Sphingomonas canadensis]MCW3835177.1 hypothetical protein [Sphingomonas canadensis]